MKIDKKTIVMFIIGALFIMSIMPGEGTKLANNQQALAIYDKYTCDEDTDCPKCVGGGIIEYNESDPNFFGELSYSACVDNKCELSDACIIWDCGDTQGDECKSVKQTVLENTIDKVNSNPAILLFIIGFIIVYLMM